MNQLRRIFPWVLVLMVTLAACGGGSGDSASTGLQPTRTPSSNTAVPRATRTPRPPTPTPIPQATARPLAANAITIESASALTVTASRQESSPTQLYTAAADRVLGTTARSFELIDAATLKSRTQTSFLVPRASSADAASMFWFTASPDATLGATMDAKGKVTFYDLGTGQATKSLSLPAPKKTSQTDIALSANGSEMVYADGIVRRFSVETGEELGTAQTMPTTTARILFAEDASRLATIQPDGSVVILDLSVADPTVPVTPTAPVILTPSFTQTDQLQFSPTGAWVGIADGLSKVELFNLNASDPNSATQMIEVSGPALPVFDAQGTRVAVLNKGVVTLYALGTADQPSEEQVLKLSGDAVPTSAHFSADGETLFVASVGGIESFKVSDGSLITSGMRLGFTRLLYTLDGKRVLSWGALTPSANVGVMDATTGDVVSQLPHDTAVRFVTLSRTGQYAATATRDGGTHVWRLSDETDLLTITASPNNERRGAVCFTPDEKGLVMIEGNEIVIEPIGSGSKRRFALPDTVTNLAGCGNAQGILAFIAENDIAIADLTGKILGTIALPSEAKDLREAALYQFSSNGRYLAGMSATALYLWDTATQELLHTVPLATPPIFGFEFNPTDSVIAVNFGDAAQLVDVSTGKVTALKVPKSPTARWLTVLFTADPKTVLTAAMVSDEASADQQVTSRTYVSGELAVWDATTGEAVHTINVPEPIYAAAINADGTQLVTGSQNNTLNVWQLKE